ncbi:uncharacterized protein LAESUDRAFT_638692 [Laetiporus sulphureus 93-53]|uniref:Glycerophosphocholine acyltransferase 1 n=1 Tax=Laetiporus sulphureus 93-53 TaxID=1314785 RepID=A0A165ICN8_9APHY|nr:uncharacterized protein LAESUDRAFT_638692 [Laetiporus sulphureus 93-53]KZT12897.1 hypothetical protein LAESUDRAFT_638692 [Laetiporus sulphureus 93-53]
MATLDSSRPPSPNNLRTSDMPIGNSMYFSVPYERFARDEVSDWASGFTLLDTLETYFDSRIDLLQRRLAKKSEKFKMRAEETLNEMFKRDLFKRKPSIGTSQQFEREMQKFKFKVSSRLISLAAAWHTANVVRTREKLTFFFGVMSLLFTSLMFGLAPEWIHIAYTLQAAYYLPMRVYLYKKRAWHYFLFDLCYYANILNLIYIWFLPSSSVLLIACYCLSHGSLASAVITWRNSLVFHDFDKVTSLFIHVYPPLTFTVIRHFYPNAEERFPALVKVPSFQPMRALLLSSIIYLVWQVLYWKFVFINRRTKIESGQRTTSLSFLLNDKRGVIGRALSKVPPRYRELSFMIGQFVYSVLTELPAVFLLYDSSFWSGAFLILIFAVSVWNGGGFYIEVFGRKFEKELEELRKELAESSPRNNGSPVLGPQDDDDVTTVSGSPSAETKSLSPELSISALPVDTAPVSN